MTRPKLFKANAYEDDILCSEDKRWPEQSSDWTSGVRLQRDPYGDVYVTARSPLSVANLKSPVEWATNGLVDSWRNHHVFRNDIEKVKTVKWEQIQMPDDHRAYEDVLASVRSKEQSAIEGAKATVVGLTLHLVFALPIGITLLGFWQWDSLGRVNRLRGELECGEKSLLEEHVDSLFHRGARGYLQRVLDCFLPYFMICTAMVVSHSLFSEHPYAWLISVSFAVVAFGVGVTLFYRLTQLTAPRRDTR